MGQYSCLLNGTLVVFVLPCLPGSTAGCETFDWAGFSFFVVIHLSHGTFIYFKQSSPLFRPTHWTCMPNPSETPLTPLLSHLPFSAVLVSSASIVFVYLYLVYFNWTPMHAQPLGWFWLVTQAHSAIHLSYGTCSLRF